MVCFFFETHLKYHFYTVPFIRFPAHKMSRHIFLGAEFHSNADLQIAFDAYCQENAINGTPLSFVQKNSSKLHTNIYKTLTLDESIVNRIVYKDRAWVCKFRANSAQSVMASCLGRITASFDRIKHVLRITSFIGEHLCQSSTERQRAAQVQRIFDLVKLIPESALVYVEQTCQSILEHWSDPSNDGVTISIVPIMRASSVPTDDEDQALERGKILTLIRY